MLPDKTPPQAGLGAKYVIIIHINMVRGSSGWRKILDLLISPITQDDQRELLEIVEERYGRRSTVITGQLPVRAWHDAMYDPTLADVILDWLVHNAHNIELKGKDPMRNNQSTLDRISGSMTP